MPPRKRTAKQAQTTSEDAPKPQKRQKKSAQAEITESAPVVPPLDESNDHLTFDHSRLESVQESASNGQKSHDQLPPVDSQGAGSGAVDEEAKEDDEEPSITHVEQPQRASDLYLDTVNRAALDFDFEKVCSVSLSNINIYGCLVCGKYFQGRSKLTPAFAHSIHDDHHVFMNLETSQVSHSYPFNLAFTILRALTLVGVHSTRRLPGI
jgi:Zn-finger in ubiquitin-hydrolases and other protein